VRTLNATFSNAYSAVHCSQNANASNLATRATTARNSKEKQKPPPQLIYQRSSPTLFRSLGFPKVHHIMAIPAAAGKLKLATPASRMVDEDMAAHIRRMTLSPREKKGNVGKFVVGYASTGGRVGGWWWRRLVGSPVDCRCSSPPCMCYSGLSLSVSLSLELSRTPSLCISLSSLELSLELSRTLSRPPTHPSTLGEHANRRRANTRPPSDFLPLQKSGHQFCGRTDTLVSD
jgi:hypothetical protein